MTPGEDNALTTRFGAMGMHITVRCCVFCFVCVREVFRASEFQQACQAFTISYFVLFARLHLLLL